MEELKIERWKIEKWVEKNQLGDFTQINLELNQVDFLKIFERDFKKIWLVKSFFYSSFRAARHRVSQWARFLLSS